MSGTGKPIFKRSTKSWWGLALSVFLVAGIIGFLEIISYNHHIILDLTPGKAYSLSEQTTMILKSLDQDIVFTTFYRGGNRNYYEAFFRRLSLHTAHIKYRLLHLDRNPALAKLHGISVYGETIVESEGKKESIALPTEEKVLNTILRLTGKSKKEIYFTEGHGEQHLQKDYSKLSNALRSEGWLAKTINLSGKKGVPGDASVLVVAGPQKDFLEKELDAISLYFHGGGNVIFMVEPFAELPEIKAFLEKYGIRLGHNIIVDTEHILLAGDYLAPLIPYFDEGPITGSLKSSALFPTAGSVEINDDMTEDLESRYLAMSAPESWTKNNEEDVRQGKIAFEKNVDRKGPIPVASMVRLSAGEGDQGGSDAEIVCFGDSDFLINEFIGILANKDLFMNTVNWLAREKDLVSIRKKEYEYPYHHMTKEQGKWAFLVPVVVVPAIFLLIGIGVLIHRRWRG